jgi:hypothetical protein
LITLQPQSQKAPAYKNQLINLRRNNNGRFY